MMKEGRTEVRSVYKEQGSQGHHRGPVWHKKGSSLLPWPTTEMFLLKCMLWVTSDFPVAQVAPLPPEVGASGQGSQGGSLPSG